MAEKKDFKYIVRIANTNIDGKKSVLYGIAEIKGIGYRLANSIIRQVEIPAEEKIGNLNDQQVELLKNAIEKDLNQYIPEWMMNRRDDPITGESFHKIGTDLDLQVQDDINLMKKMRAYKGIRHEHGLPVRGQRTKNNGRVGMSISLGKKKPEPKPEVK
jgi:small subunit ribosomal protein S13